MAKCKCGVEWLWDWKLDCFVNSKGKLFKEKDFHSIIDGLEFNATTFTCKCKRVNAILIVHPEIGAESIYPDNHKFNEIDWQLEEHSYEE